MAAIQFPHYIHLAVTLHIASQLCFQVTQNSGYNLHQHLETQTLPKYLPVTGTVQVRAVEILRIAAT